ncbi:MAG: universal stress protein [Jatrophihabitans sp.]
MSRYDTVVVGIDGSDVARDALHWAADEAHLRGSRLLVAHADDLPRVAADPYQPGVRPVAQILRAEAVAAATARHPDLVCEAVLCHGDAAQTLIDLSACADLLVVGTHRLGRQRGFVLGSVSQRVAAHAACPVVTVSGPQEETSGPLVLGASTSPGGLAALRFACEEARLRGVPIRAIRAATAVDWTTGGPGHPPAISFEGLERAAQAELDAVIAEAARQFPDVRIEDARSTADVFTALQVEAATASLVVLGARHDTATALAHLGPVAAWLLHQAQCPLAIVAGPRSSTIDAEVLDSVAVAPV